jgi:hypothetical protein
MQNSTKQGGLQNEVAETASLGPQVASASVERPSFENLSYAAEVPRRFAAAC